MTEVSEAEINKTIDSVTFNSVLGRQFSKIIIGNTGLPGNYAGFDIKEAQLNGSGAVKFANNNILTFSLSAGITEGVASLFNNSKANPNISFGLTYSFLLPFSKLAIITDTNKKNTIKQSMKNIIKFHNIEIDQLDQKLKYYNTINSLTTDSLSTISKIMAETLRDIGIFENLKARTETETIKLQKLRTKLTTLIETNYKILHLKDSITGLINTMKNDITLVSEGNVKFASAPHVLNATGCNIRWLSMGYKLGNRNFFLFDSSQVYANQTSKKDFTSHQITITYNHFSWNDNRFGSWYFGAGLAFTLEDNQAILHKTEITETYTYAGAPKARSEQKKYTVFRGDYKKDIRSVKPHIDFYYFLLKSQAIAIHFFPEVQFSKSSKPLTNVGTGIFFTFADKNDKTGKAKINAELYVKFNDTHNNLETKNYSFYERNDIGVRLSVPLNFNP